jgi:hypothetical protein
MSTQVYQLVDENVVADINTFFAGKNIFIGSTESWKATFSWLFSAASPETPTKAFLKRVAACVILAEHPARLITTGTRMKKDKDGKESPITIDKRDTMDADQLKWCPYSSDVPIDVQTGKPREWADHLNKLNLAMAKRVALWASDRIRELPYMGLYQRKYGSSPSSIGKAASVLGSDKTKVIATDMGDKTKEIACKTASVYYLSYTDMVQVSLIWVPSLKAMFPTSF